MGSSPLNFDGIRLTLTSNVRADLMRTHEIWTAAVQDFDLLLELRCCFNEDLEWLKSLAFYLLGNWAYIEKGKKAIFFL